MVRVAIITVNYNGKKDTLQFLESLSKLQTTNPSTSLAFGEASLGAGYQLLTIVVDNGSSDGLVTTLVKDYPDVVVLQNGGNKGFAGGYNRGLEYAQIWGAEYFLVVNNDTLIKDKNLLEELIKVAESDPKIGLVSPKIYFAPGFEFHKDKYSSKDLGKVIWYGGGYFDWDNIQANHRGIDEVDLGKYDVLEEVDFVSGACLLIKREVIEKVGTPAGVFDEKLFAYLEDVDFLKRAKDLGFKAFYNGKVAVYHKVSQTSGIGSSTTDYYHARNRLIIGFKYGRLRTRFALLREALKLLVAGRRAQRKGVLDFYLGITGGVYLTHPRGVIASHPEYPLKLSIGTLNYNTADLIKKLLQSIFNGESGYDEKNMEVIVLDNGSGDSCRTVIKEYLPKIKYLENKENEGFTKGYNKLIRFSRGEYFLMFNSDIEVLKGGLKELVKWADHFRGEAVLGGKLIFPDKSRQNSSFHLPSLTGAFKEYFLAQKGSYFMFEPAFNKPGRVEGLVMACYLIPQKILGRVGLLDEGTFIFFEDIEYAARLKRFGVPIYFIPTAKFIHHHGGSTKRIGLFEAQKLLEKSARHYHGQIYFFLLSLILRLGQKLGRVKTPQSRWVKQD